MAMLTSLQNVLTLKGITLRGSIDLCNKNQNLAVIFQIEPPQDINLRLCIQPRRGIIMQGQTKMIKFWISPQDRQKTYGISFTGKPLKINMTMKAEYNRKIMVHISIIVKQQKYNMGGWQKIKKSYQTLQLPIVISSQSSQIRQSLKSSANNNSLHKNSIQNAYSQKLYTNTNKNIYNRNQFRSGQSAHYNVGGSGGSGSGSGYANSNILYGANGNGNDVRVMEKKISQKLERELEFLYQQDGSDVFDNRRDRDREGIRDRVVGEPEIVTYGSKPATKTPKFQPNNIVTYQTNTNTQPQPQTTPYQNNNPTRIYPSDNTPTNAQIKAASNQRFLQVIMLAALAGFFAALGSNLKHLFS